MRILSNAIKIATCALFIMTLSSLAHAQTRTWVSGVGSDANSCSRTAPCKTFAGAIAKTAAGGEISVLDPGGYGTITATKSITIDGAGTLASILASGGTGITVNDAATPTPNTIVVTVRNLSIQGAGAMIGVHGINFTSGKTLNVENVDIQNFTTTGIRVAPAASGANVNIKNANIFKSGTGVSLSAAAGFVTASLDNCRIENNATGVSLSTNGFATVRNSIINFNTTGVATVSGTAVTLENCEVNHNSGTGFNIVAGATGRLSGTMIILNGTNISNLGTIVTWNNNKIQEASIPGTVTSLTVK